MYKEELSVQERASPFGGHIFRGHPIRGQERGSGGPLRQTENVHVSQKMSQVRLAIALIHIHYFF